MNVEKGEMKGSEMYVLTCEIKNKTEQCILGKQAISQKPNPRSNQISIQSNIFSNTLHLITAEMGVHYIKMIYSRSSPSWQTEDSSAWDGVI